MWENIKRANITLDKTWHTLDLLMRYEEHWISIKQRIGLSVLLNFLQVEKWLRREIWLEVKLTAVLLLHLGSCRCHQSLHIGLLRVSYYPFRQFKLLYRMLANLIELLHCLDLIMRFLPQRVLDRFDFFAIESDRVSFLFKRFTNLSSIFLLLTSLRRLRRVNLQLCL